jgi:Carboxypeptidase regulatory-like domain/TonB dependent receptor
MKKIFAVTYLACFLPLGLNAQTAAKIFGVVHDQDGQAVAAASVDATGQKSAEKRKVTTSGNGEFTLSELPPDTYQITATCGTCNDASSVVEVGAGQSRNVQLEVNTKSSSDVISVDTHATTLDASSATLGINVTGTEIASLPVNGRNIAPLALTAPLVTNAGGANYSDLRFDGQSLEQSRYTVDGVDASSVVKAAPGFVPAPGFDFRLRTSVETVDEFRVDSAGYSSEDGGVTGAQIKLVSRAAGQAWHGSLFEYFRNDKLQARNFFDGANPTELRMNQFGGNAGGQVVKDKVFAFGSFEQLKQRAGLDLFESVPSADARARAAADVLPVLQILPAGFSATGDPDVDQSERRAVASQDETNLNARVDYLINAKQRLFVRYSRSSGTLLSPDNTTSARNISAQSAPDQSVVHWTDQVSTNIMDSLTLGVNRAPTRVSVLAAGTLGEARIGIGNAVFGGMDSPGGLTQLSSGDYGSGADYHGRTYSLQDGVTWLKGPHSISIGGEVRLVRVPFSTQGGTLYLFGGLDSFLSDQDVAVTYVADMPARTAEQEQYGWYAHDDWRISPQMLITFGLRYDYFSATREAQNRAELLNLNTFQVTPANGGFYAASKNGFEPRVAMTWSPKRLKGDTVFRIGAGIYDGTNAFLDTVWPIENSASRFLVDGVTYPQTSASLLGSGALQAMPRALDSSSFGRPQQNYVYTASVQQALPHQFVGQIAYLGSQSRHLAEEGVANLSYGIDPLTGGNLRPFTAFTPTDYLTNGGNSSYNALQLGLNRHLVDNLTLSTSYTWSRSIGDTQGAGDELAPQNPTCFECERADNNFDVRQSFNMTAVYGLPFGKNFRHLSKGWLSQALGGWTIAGAWNARTGLPVDVTIQRSNELFYSAQTGQYYSPYSDAIPANAVAMVNTPYGGEDRSVLRPNLIPGVNPYLKSDTGTLYLNPAAFAIPAAGTYGNLGRNSLRGPGFTQVDLQLSRTFAITERDKLQLRAEAFNLLNHPNFSNPTAMLPDALVDVQPNSAFNSTLASGFGMVNSTVGRTVGLGTSRQLQLSARFEF